MNRLSGDVDIDFANRTNALSVLEHIPASLLKNKQLEKHNTGVYFHAVPIDPVTGVSSVTYDYAKTKGWYKMDLLNVNIYEMVRDEAHLQQLMDEPINWTLFEFPEFTKKLIHLHNHSELVAKLKPTSLDELAIVLALIRPAKRHLIDQCIKYGFQSVEKETWTIPSNGEYAFKRSHSLSYAMLVKVHANLIIEQSMVD